MPTPEETNKLLTKAIAFNEARSFQQTIDLLTEEVLEQHANGELFTERAYAHGSLGQIVLLKFYLDKAFIVSSGHSQFYYLSGYYWSSMQDYQQAIANFTKTIEFDPQYAAAYNNRGNAWDEIGHYDQAIADHTKAIELNPQDATNYYNRGNVWDKKGDYNQAIADYTKAIELNPQLAAAYFNRGNVWDKKGNYDQAIADYTKAIELNPQLAITYYNRGLTWNKKGNYYQAIADCTKAIELNPQLAAAYYNRGLAWNEKGDYDRAIADYTKAIKLNPQDALAYYKRGLTWNNKGDYDQAIADHTKAIELNPQLAAVYYNRGLTWNEKGDYDQAIADCTKAIELDSQDATTYNNRGIIWNKKGNYDQAIADYIKAIELNPQLATAYNNRGNVWDKKGDYDQAIADYTKAIELDSQDATTYFNISLTYYTINNHSLSLQYLNRATYLQDHPVRLIRQYHRYFLLPFMLQRLLQHLEANHIRSFAETFSDNEQYCRNWEIVAQLLQQDNTQLSKSITGLRTKAMIEYFMGDCITSFRIYDEDIDSSDRYTLSLRDQYYYVKSAQDFLEPIGGILEFALKQADREATKTIENSYYAGQLYRLSGEPAIAEKYFLSAASVGFRPALYQLVSLYDNVLHNPDKRTQVYTKIQNLEAKDASTYELINGIPPLLITSTDNLLEEIFDYCKYYAYYAENIEEIQLVRNFLQLNHPYKRYEFWEAIVFDPAKEDGLLLQADEYELRLFEQQVFRQFDDYCQQKGRENILNEILFNGQGAQALQNIRNSVNEPGSRLTYELALAREIKNLKRNQILARWFLVIAKLFYLEGNVSAKEAVCLHLYATDVASKLENQAIIDEIDQEVQVWFSSFFTMSSPLLTKLLFKSFKIMQDYFGSKKPQTNETLEYMEFKSKYDYHLDFWRKTLAKKLFDNAE